MKPEMLLNLWCSACQACCTSSLPFITVINYLLNVDFEKENESYYCSLL